MCVREIPEAIGLATMEAHDAFVQDFGEVCRANEAVFFQFGSRTYLSVDDNKAAFAPKFDLVADVTGMQYKTGDLKKGSLSVGNYFA